MTYQSTKGNPIENTWFNLTNLVFLGFIIIIVLSACNSLPSNIVSRVGNEVITPRDIAYRQAVQEVRSGEDFPGYLALFQLLEEALMVEVAREMDVVVTDEMLLQEAARVEEETRDPETLAEIQDVFGNDNEAYRRLVLKPILINQLLHARFSLSHDIQAEPLARAKKALAAAQRAPDSLPDLAEEFEGQYKRMRIVDGHLEVGGGGEQEATDEHSLELDQYGVAFSDYDQAFVDQVVKGLEEGNLHPKVIEDRRSFMVVRLLNRDGDDAQLESMVIPKLAFDPWFKSQSQNIELFVYDQTLKNGLLENVDVPYITDRLSTDQ
jgi:hypothetical protein